MTLHPEELPAEHRTPSYKKPRVDRADAHVQTRVEESITLRLVTHCRTVASASPNYSARCLSELI